MVSYDRSCCRVLRQYCHFRTKHWENAEKGCYRISLGNTLTIPARSCKVVEVDIGKSASSGEAPRVCLVECLPTLAEMYGIVMGSQLVELTQDKVPINLINVHDTPVSMNKGKTLSSIQRVQAISLIESSAKSSKAKHSQNCYHELLTLNGVPEHTWAVLVGAELTAEKTSDACHLIMEDPDRFVGPDGKTRNSDCAQMVGMCRVLLHSKFPIMASHGQNNRLLMKWIRC